MPKIVTAKIRIAPPEKAKGLNFGSWVIGRLKKRENKILAELKRGQ